MRPATIPALVVVVAALLLADLLVVNASISEIAGIAVDATILVAAGAALAAAVSLALRRGGDLWRRRGDPIGAAFVLAGMGAMLVAGLRPGSGGVADPAVMWLVVALLVPIGATLFGLLFVTTLDAARRSVAGGSREALLMVGAAAVALLLLLPLGGAGGWLAGAVEWTLMWPIGAVFRGMLIGVAILASILAARTLLGLGSSDD